MLGPHGTFTSMVIKSGLSLVLGAGCVLGLLTAADTAVDVPAKEPGFYLHHFEYDPPPGASPQKVAVGGEFNDWSETGFPLKADSAGHWTADVKLAEGPHAYRFFVDGAWTNDIQQRSDPSLEESNGIRGHNSAIFVGPDERSLPRPQPGLIALDGLHFAPGNVRYFDPISATEVRIGFVAQEGNLTAAAVYSQDGRNWRKDDLSRVETRTGTDLFAGVVLSRTLELTYFFELKNGATTGYYAAGKYFTQLAGARQNAYRSSMQPAFETPAWAQHAVWYQIFPERFRNGDKSNDPPNTAPWTMKWAAPMPGDAGRGGRGNNVNNRRYGGDIQGIRAQLPYLRSLGVTCLYLNPVFKSPSLHKYDTTDYRHVDDNFGVAGDLAELSGETEDPATWKWSRSDRLLLDFVAEAHRQGFKVILDGVFNHAGSQFAPFLDARQNGKNSRFASWFNISNWEPFTWISFGGRAGGNMPEFRKDPVTGLAPGPRDFVLAITKRWLAPDGDAARGVDGFRLDYAQNVPRVFWVTYRKFVKSVKPDALIAGEIWTPASSYLQGDTWDATMQYPFANALQAFFIGGSQKPITASVFAERLRTFNVDYPFQVALDQMNLLDSHDTDRWASRFVNADHPPAADSGAGRRAYNQSKPDALEWQRMEQSLVAQMTYVGAPMIYYGDEVGMWAGTDPDDRQPMIWKDLAPYDDPEVQFNQPLFDCYVRLIAIHRRFAALQTGFGRVIFADDARGIVAFSRDLGDASVYVVINKSPAPQNVGLQIGPRGKDAALIDWLDPAQAAVRPADSRSPDARPVIQPAPGARPAVVARNGKATVSLKAWGAMILAPANAN